VRLSAATGGREIAPDALANGVIAIGNEFVQATYRERGLQVWGIDNSNIPTRVPDLEHKNFDTARRNFLWIGGNGLIHKGLDLVLEAFADLVQQLWVCGELQSAAESELVHCYRRELFHTPTIHSMGWVDIHSAQFRQLTDQCAFAILLPASDAMATSVLVAMGQGLIPIVSREVGLDTADFGFTLDTTDVREIRRRIQELAQLPVEQCRAMAKQAYHLTQTRYSYSAFAHRIEQVLQDITETK
jgi:glycosyltransferase involved in cell wall biosynthesis